MSHASHAPRHRLMVLTAALLFTFTFIGLPSFGQYYLKTDMFSSLDMVGWMSRLTDSATPELSSDTGTPSLLHKGVKVQTTSIRSTSVMDSSMGVMDSSMGVMDSSMGVK